MAIKKNNIVEKRNVLNEVRNNNMTLQELRFFSIYLSKINARDLNTRKVRFPLADFQRIMDIGRINIQHFKQITDSLLCQIVHLPTERGGYTAFQLFKRCTVDQDDCGEWFVEIDAHDDALPLMFDFKREYFTYELWNALRLKSTNQIRMYELLKQYENIGRREIKVEELRELLGIAKDEYPRWNNFKVRILDSCQQSLSENTDIKFTYSRGKVANGGKWITIVFTITKNEDHVDPLSLAEFINQQDVQPIDVDNKPIALPVKRSSMDDDTRLHEYLSGMGKNYAEAQQLINEAHAIMLDNIKDGNGIRNTYGYMKAIIDNKLKQDNQRPARYQKAKEGQFTESELKEIESFAINSKENIEKYIRNQENL